MSVLAFAGAELGSTAELSNVTGITMETSIVHGGKYSYRIANGGAGYFIFAAHTTPVYFRGYFYLPAGHTTYTQLITMGDATLATLGGLYVYSPAQGSVFQLNSLSQAWQGTSVVPESVWHRLEFMLSGSGVCEIRINGRREILRTDFVQAFPMASIGLLAFTPAAGNVIWDDIHITEDGWPGPGYVIVRQGRPGPPSFQAFTKTGGPIEVCWSDTPTSIATNAVSTAASQTQMMLVDALSQVSIAAKYGAQRIAARDTVFGAKVYAHGHRVGASPDHYIVRISAGVVTRSGPFNFTASDTYQASAIFSATLAELDALEIGAARGNLVTTSNLFVNDMWLIVSYAQAPNPMLSLTGFETGSISEVVFGGTLAIDTTQVRSGVYAAKGIGPALFLWLPVDPLFESANLWVRGYVYLQTFPPSQDIILVLHDVSRNIDMGISILSDGRARLSVGAISATTLTPAFVLGAWNYVEAFKRATVTSGDGAATVWVNNQQLTMSVVDTGGATVGAVWGAFQTAMTLWFDDLALSETGRIGPGRVVARQGVPSLPAHADWVPVGGNIDAVWSNTPSNAATYAQALRGGASAQTMLVNPQANGGAVLRPTDTVIACRIVAMARYDTGVGTAPSALHYRMARAGQAPLVKTTAVVITNTTTRLVYGDVFATLPETLATLEIGGNYYGLSDVLAPLINGTFEDWNPTWSATLPNRWNIFGVGGSAVQDMAAGHVHGGLSSVALTRSGATTLLYQDLVTTERPLSWWFGRTVTMTAWVRATVANSAYLGIDDSLASVVSKTHSGSGLFEQLTTTFTVPPTGLRVLIGLFIATVDTTAQFDDVVVTLPAIINPLLNGEVEQWTGSLPTSWNIFGAGATSAQDTAATHVHGGVSSAALTRVGTDCFLYQDLVTTQRPLSWWVGRTVTLTAWVRATVASRALIQMFDSVTAVNSNIHSGSGFFERCTLTFTVAPTATRVTVALFCISGDTTVQFDDVTLTVPTAIGAEPVLRIEDLWLMVAYADLQILDLPAPSTPAPVAIVEIQL